MLSNSLTGYYLPNKERNVPVSDTTGAEQCAVAGQLNYLYFQSLNPVT